MSDAATGVRQATTADVPAMFEVRTSVTENLLTLPQLARMGITPQSVTASLSTGTKGWVAEENGFVVGFSLANSETSSIFALFVLPSHEGRGYGSKLLADAVHWLREVKTRTIWLDTGRRSRAVEFYRRRGWRIMTELPTGEFRMELPPDARPVAT